jgi:flagellin
MASILNNVGAMQSRRHLSVAERELNGTIGRLSTGMRITRAADDAAGLQISNNLRADIKVLGQARRNANDGIGRISIADGVLEEATNLLTRAAQLAEQAASGTTSSAGRVAIHQEWTEIQSALNDLGANTKIDGSTIFGNSTSVRVGEAATEVVTFVTASLSATDLAVNSASMLTSDNASVALSAITTAIETVSSERGQLGAKQQRLYTLINSIGITMENTQAAESQIRDADVADEVVNLTKFQILTQTGVSSLAQANQSAQSVLSLLG